MNPNPAFSVKVAVVALAFLACTGGLCAQQTKETQGDARTPAGESDLDRHLDELTSKLDSMREQLIESQSEMDELRRELHSLRQQLAEQKQGDRATQVADALRASVAQLEDDTEILKAQVKQHDQSKVETLSKYPVRINGQILFTSVLNSGNADNVNVPIVALPSGPGRLTGSLSATANQTTLGVDAIGPHLWGARSRGDLSFDLWGGASSSNYTATAGMVRFRTMHARVDWPGRTVSMVIDRPLIAPWEPTSWVTVAEPALAWSGNLWAWSPQVEFKQDNFLLKHMRLDAGLIFPNSPYAYISGQSEGPNAAERSRQPGYVARVGPELSWHDHPVYFGASGYYSRQAYNYDQHVDAWAGAGDWKLELSRWLAWSGEAYRGRGIGGLGGGTFKDYVSYAASDSLRGLDAAGGWTQAKVTMSPSIEANFSAGLDSAFAHELRGSDQAAASSYYATLTRNQTVIANLVYRPRSYLLMSAEFRQINSRFISGWASENRIFGVATGYLF